MAEAKEPKKRIRYVGPTRRFEEFWAAVVVKKAKKTTRELWGGKRLDDKADEIIAAYKRQLEWPEYRGERICYMPQPPQWIRNERWEDEPDPRFAAPAKGRPSRNAEAVEDYLNGRDSIH